MVLAMAACTLEIFLCYTGYIRHCLWLVDYSESIAFLIGPAFYLMTNRLIHGNSGKFPYVHLAIPFIWLMLQIPFLLQQADVKFNAWLGAYHPAGFSFKDVGGDFFTIPYHSEFVMLQIGFYLVLSFGDIFRAFKERKESFWKPTHPLLKNLRSGFVQSVIILVLILTVKIVYRDDMGDHFFAAYVSIAIYIISFQVITQSGFFERPHLAGQQRYKNALATPHEREALLDKLRQHMAAQMPYLQPGFSLSELAGQLRVSTHQLSQVINEGLGKNFFEMAAEYRVEEAKVRLRNQPHIKVEEIAEQVGYLSKSAFNTAFKKQTGQTPSEWRSTL